MNDPRAEWFRVCEWNEQDATRTLDHAEDLIAGWLAGLDELSGAERDTIASAAAVARTQAVDGHESAADRAVGLWASLSAIADLRAVAGDVVEHQVGSVDRINSSSGGVPKLAVETATCGWRGLDGDVQATRVHHGRPWQALSLWSADVIDRFRADGHPVEPGAAGENLTLRGLDWSALRAGAVIDIGEIRCQLTAPAVPCSKIAHNFVDRDLALIDHDVHPGASRWYAAVVRPGSISAGDRVTVSPDASES